MTVLQPELWVDRSGEALAFYQATFGAWVLHRIGGDDDLIAQLGIGDAVLWIAATPGEQPTAGPTGHWWRDRTADARDPRSLCRLRPGGRCGWAAAPPVGTEHRWRVGRVIDPFGDEWEIGQPVITWPPQPPPS